MQPPASRPRGFSAPPARGHHCAPLTARVCLGGGRRQLREDRGKPGAWKTASALTRSHRGSPPWLGKAAPPASASTPLFRRKWRCTTTRRDAVPGTCELVGDDSGASALRGARWQLAAQPRRLLPKANGFGGHRRRRRPRRDQDGVRIHGAIIVPEQRREG